MSHTRTAIQQSDGKILVLNTSSLNRYNADGSPDKTFADGGSAPTPVLSSAYSVTTQFDAKILVVGHTGSGSTSDIALWRYNSNGSLDTAFGRNGIVTTAMGTRINEWGTSVATQQDGSIVVAGQIYRGGEYYFNLSRYDSSGTLDATFGDAGIVSISFAANTENYVQDVAIQADGKILLAGTMGGDFALLRYHSNGALDHTFGTGGVAKTNFYGVSYDNVNDIILQSDGNILLAGSSGRDIAIARYNPSGQLDPSFNDNGKLVIKLVEDSENSADVLRSIVVQPDGKIVAAGTHQYYRDNTALKDLSLVRLNADGSLDASFGSQGVVTTDFGRDDEGYSILLLSNDKLLVAGKSLYDYAFARYNNDGTLDDNFGNSSVTYRKGASSIVLDSDIRIFDPYHYSNSYQYASLTLARNGGANLDDYFSGSGIAQGQAQGNVIVSGYVIGTYSQSNGTLSINFGRDATQVRVDRLMQSIVYTNNGNKSPEDIKIDWLFSDNNSGPQGSGGALSAVGQTTMSFFVTRVGNDGVDAIHYTQTRSQFALERNEARWIIDGPDTLDVLIDIERLQFSDVDVALDLSGNAGTVAKILGAVFGPGEVANESYAGIGLYYIDGGMTYESLMQLALDARLGPGAGHQAVVDLLYTNVVGAPPGEADRAHFVGLLDGGEFTIPGLGVYAADYVMNLDNIDLIGLADQGLEYVPYVEG